MVFCAEQGVLNTTDNAIKAKEIKNRFICALSRG